VAVENPWQCQETVANIGWVAVASVAAMIMEDSGSQLLSPGSL